MTLSALIKKGGLRKVANAIPATPATEENKTSGLVATIATLAIASFKGPQIGVTQGLPPRAWVVEEVCDGDKVRAVKICSAVLQDRLWIVIDRNYQPTDGLAIYYPEELTELATKTAEQLREIHKVKLAFPGARVIQEGAERLNR